MLKLDDSLDHIPAKRAHVVALYESINQPIVNLPGYGAAPTSAYVLSTRNARGAYAVFAYLYHRDVATVDLGMPQKPPAVVVYVSSPRKLTQALLKVEEAEAVRFVESMGFLLDNLQFQGRTREEQQKIIDEAPLFRPSTGLRVPTVDVILGKPSRAKVPKPPKNQILRASSVNPDHIQANADLPTTEDTHRRQPGGDKLSLGRGLKLPTSDLENKTLSKRSVARLGRLLAIFSCLFGLCTQIACVNSRTDPPRAHQAMIDIAGRELSQGRPIEALKQLEPVMSEDEKNADAHELAGMAYLQVGRIPKAQDHLEQAVALNPKGSNAKNTLAVILLEQNACQRALDMLNEVKDDVFYRKQDYVQHNLALAESCLGNADAALSRLERLTRISPKFCLAHLTRSEIAEKANRYEITVQSCDGFRDYCVKDEALGASIPNDLKATCDLRKGRAYIAIGDVESARTAFRRCRLQKITKKACSDALQLLPP